MQRRMKALLAITGLALGTGAGAGVIVGQDFYSAGGDSLYCYDLLRADDARNILRADELEERETRSGNALRAGGSTRCTVLGTGKSKANLQIRFDWDSDAPSLLSSLDRANPHEGQVMVTPLGSGWRGVLNLESPIKRAAVYLRCQENGKRDLVVTIRAYPDQKSGSTLAYKEKVALAQVTTRVAEGAAREWGCKASFGTDVNEIPRSTPSFVEAGKATGTCEGLDHAVYEVPASEEAPIEDCIIANAEGQRMFRLSAYFGPYVESAREQTIRGETFGSGSGGGGGTYWTTAECPTGEALFTIEPLETGTGFPSPQPDMEQAALETFATRSTESHGCSQPVLQ